MDKSSLAQHFEQQVDAAPDAVALSFEETQVTYRQLNRRANRVAHRLRAMGAGPEVLVGLCVERSVDLVVGVLAILKAGAAYVPLDPAYPKERLRFMLEDTQAPVILTQRCLMSGLPTHSANVVCLEQLERQLQQNDREVDENPDSGVGPNNLAYVIYTSGSTGKPKGVLVTHTNVIRLFDATKEWFRFGTEDTWTLFHSYAFDFSVWEIWGALLYGGRLVIVPHWISRSPQALCELLVREHVTVLNQTPSMFRQLIEAEASIGTSSSELALRVVIFGGEALELQNLKPWIARHGDARPQLVNMYGITETTVHVTYRRILAEDIENGSGSVIGIPIPDLQVYLLDQSMRPVSTGVEGEMYVGGAGLARGYLNRAQLTKVRFVLNPFSDSPDARLYKTGDLARYRPDGDLEYVGRTDQQIKIRGFRVEPGEIETSLEAHPTIKHAVVLMREDDVGDKRLVAYVVTRAGHRFLLSDLRSHLQNKLPEYMIPSTFVAIDSIPLTPNGKLDHSALPAPENKRPELDQAYVAPRNVLEHFLSSLWSKLLKLDRIGIHDKFFELGGDSLLAARFINTMQSELGKFIYIATIFEAPSIAEYARFLEHDYPGEVAKRFGLNNESTVNPQKDRLTESRSPRIDAVAVQRMRECVPHFLHSEDKEKEEARNPPAIFILAPPRSGTTLLRIMLAGHPQLFGAAELNLLGFNTLAERRAAFVGKFSLWLEGTIRAIMEIKKCGVEEAKQIMKEYESRGYTTKQFYRVLQDWLGDQILVDKTPSYALGRNILEKAEHDFDDAMYIHLVRHPYAMVRSFEELHVDQVLFLEKHPFSPRQLGELVWVLTHQKTVEFLQKVPKHRWCRLRFEDLVQRPQPVMENLCKTLGLSFHPDLVEPYKDVDKKMVNGIYPESTPMGDTKFLEHSNIDTKIAESWRNVFADNFLGDITWELAKLLGYELPSSSSVNSGDNPHTARRGVTMDRRERLERYRQDRQQHEEL